MLRHLYLTNRNKQCCDGGDRQHKSMVLTLRSSPTVPVELRESLPSNGCAQPPSAHTIY
ncbi:MAG: hypothetical protein AAF889_03110 [Cyanobacteria bacterium P01_D01_bin.73]